MGRGQKKGHITHGPVDNPRQVSTFILRITQSFSTGVM